MTGHLPRVALAQVNLVVRDMRRSLAFYRLLGLSIDATEPSGWGLHHARAATSDGMRVEFDSVAFAKQWNPGLDESRLGGAVFPLFEVAAREDVDLVHARVTAGGHRSVLAPNDAFWGARYAIVADPDGNTVGIGSPIDPARKRPPPPLPALPALPDSTV